MKPKPTTKYYVQYKLRDLTQQPTLSVLQDSIIPMLKIEQDGNIEIQQVQQMEVLSTKDIPKAELKEILASTLAEESEQKRLAEIQKLKERLAMLEGNPDVQ